MQISRFFNCNVIQDKRGSIILGSREWKVTILISSRDWPRSLYHLIICRKQGDELKCILVKQIDLCFSETGLRPFPGTSGERYIEILCLTLNNLLRVTKHGNI